MIDVLLVFLTIVVAIPLGLVVGGYIYGKVTGYDEVQTVNDAVSEAQERRDD